MSILATALVLLSLISENPAMIDKDNVADSLCPGRQIKTAILVSRQHSVFCPDMLQGGGLVNFGKGVKHITDRDECKNPGTRNCASPVYCAACFPNTHVAGKNSIINRWGPFSIFDHKFQNIGQIRYILRLVDCSPYVNLLSWRLPYVFKQDLNVKGNVFGRSPKIFDFYFLDLHPWAQIGFHGLESVFVTVDGSPNGFTVHGQRPPNKKDTSNTQGYGYKSRYGYEESPHRHLPLGVKIGLVTLLVSGGLSGIGYAFYAFSNIKPDTALALISGGIGLYLAGVLLACIPII